MSDNSDDRKMINTSGSPVPLVQVTKHDDMLKTSTNGNIYTDKRSSVKHYRCILYNNYSAITEAVTRTVKVSCPNLNFN